MYSCASSNAISIQRWMLLSPVSYTHLDVYKRQVLGWAMFGEKNYVLIGISGLVFTIFLLITLTLMLDPDKIRARQSLSVLGLASNLLEGMQGGFNSTSAQHACEILHRSSSASAVAITDTENILGYCGTGEDSLPHGRCV